MSVGERIQSLLLERGISQNKLAKKAQISQSGLSSIISGSVSPKENTLQAIASALGCTVSELLGVGSAGFVNLHHASIPIVGEIACGVPITAQENVIGYADLPEGVRADFALKCKGDSMTPTFHDGDFVLIRQQPEVEDGQIAAVDLDGEATLKHVYRQSEGLLLVADNKRYAPIFARDNVRIYGLAVGFTRIFE